MPKDITLIVLTLVAFYFIVNRRHDFFVVETRRCWDKELTKYILNGTFTFESNQKDENTLEIVSVQNRYAFFRDKNGYELGIGQEVFDTFEAACAYTKIMEIALQTGPQNTFSKIFLKRVVARSHLGALHIPISNKKTTNKDNIVVLLTSTPHYPETGKG